jgi:hypothetical protein
MGHLDKLFHLLSRFIRGAEKDIASSQFTESDGRGTNDRQYDDASCEDT